MIEDRIHIEFARSADAIEIATLSKRDIEYGLGWRYTPKRIRTLIKDDSRNVVVARSGHKLAGFGIMTYYEDQANLDLLAVRRSFRRMRIGTCIVEWLEKVAVTAGACNIFVQVRETNTGAIRFYRQLGFSVLDRKPAYYRGVETAIIMVKNLRRMFA